MKPQATEWMSRAELVELCFVRALKIKKLEDQLKEMLMVIRDSTDKTAADDMQKLREVVN